MSIIRFRPVAVVAVGASALALGLSACSSGSSTASAPSSRASASATNGSTSLSAQNVVDVLASKTAAASTANFSLTVASTTTGQSSQITAKGKLDTKAGKLAMTLSTKGAAGAKAATLQEIVTGKTIYMTGLPGLPKDTWVEMPLTDLAKFGASTAGEDPAQQLQLLTKYSDGVTKVGSATVNGVATTEYTGELNLDKVANATSTAGSSAAAVAQAEQQYKALGLTKVPFQLYLDAQGLPARMVTTVKSGASAAQQISAVSTIDYTDWGTAVDIEAPAKAVSLGKLMGSAKS